MGEPDIKLARIDNRLIHGQVATQWNGTLGTNLILVANDEVAGNKMRQGLMDMAAPNGVATRYFTLQNRCYPQGFSKPAHFPCCRESRGCPHSGQGRCSNQKSEHRQYAHG